MKARILVAASLLSAGWAAHAGAEELATGSHLPLPGGPAISPVVVFEREQIRSGGYASLGDFLQRMPEQGGALNTNVNDGGDGQTQVSLRTLGAQRTLVLVDGKRWVNGGSGAGSAVDLNSIPTAAIERVEVLKDGASAVYGSDAIAGVVNVITRRRMNGVELVAFGGLTPQGDAQQYDLSVIGGATSDRGSFLFGAGYFDQKAIVAGSRDWAANALTYDYASGTVTKGGSPTIPLGRAAVDLHRCNGNPLCAQLAAAFGDGLRCNPDPAIRCVKTFMPDPTSPACSGPVAAGSDFTKCQVSGWRPMVGIGFNPQNGPTNDLYNFQAVHDLITPSQRIELFSNGDFDLSSAARAYFQGGFVNRRSETLIAPVAFGTSAVASRLSADSVYNPFGAACPGCTGTGQAVTAARRLDEAGGRSTGYDLDTVRTVAGIGGTLPDAFAPLQGVFWDLSFTYGRTWGTTTYNGSLNAATPASWALGPTHPDPTSSTGYGCGPASAPIPGCTPANLFGPPGTMTPSMLSSLGLYTGVGSGWTQLASVQANVGSELFKLASDQPVALAAGYEYRNEYGGFVPDPIGAAGLSFDFNATPVKGSFHLNEGYAELDVPVVSHAPAAEHVDVQAAFRVYDYSTFGAGAVYKVGGLWRPVRGVALRGTWSTNIREPGVSELYAPRRQVVTAALDPCFAASPTSALGQRCLEWASRQGGPTNPYVCNGDGCGGFVVPATVGGNPDLLPERASVGTAGLLLEPAALRGFSAAVGYYNVKVKQAIGAIGVQNILNGCYFGGTDAFCTLIARNSPDGSITSVLDTKRNFGTTQTSGFDFSARYSLPIARSRIRLLFDSTYLVYYRQDLGYGVLSSAGNYDLGSGTAIGSLTPRLKFNAGIDCSISGFDAGVLARYIGGFDECAGSDGANAGRCSLPVDSNGMLIAASPYPPHHVPAYVTFDLQLGYRFRNPLGTTTLAAGVRNVFDATPPYVYNEPFIFTDPGYDLAGRFVYGRIEQVF